MAQHAKVNGQNERCAVLAAASTQTSMHERMAGIRMQQRSQTEHRLRELNSGLMLAGISSANH
jgi:hypothetical protein